MKRILIVLKTAEKKKLRAYDEAYIISITWLNPDDNGKIETIAKMRTEEDMKLPELFNIRSNLLHKIYNQWWNHLKMSDNDVKGQRKKVIEYLKNELGEPPFYHKYPRYNKHGMEYPSVKKDSDDEGDKSHMLLNIKI